jgi:hypothetical protein
MKDTINMVIDEYKRNGREPNTIIMGREEFDKVPLDIIECGDEFDYVMGLILHIVGEPIIAVGETEVYKKQDYKPREMQ